MRTKKTMLYCCEYCGMEFADQSDCKLHEQTHKQMKNGSVRLQVDIDRETYEAIKFLKKKSNPRISAGEAKMLRKNPRQPLKLVKRTFVIENFQESELRRHGEKRSYTKPDHEVQVRGYYRTTKTGKRIWVKPFSRYKDRGKRECREYKL